MKQVMLQIICLAHFCAKILCQEFQENIESSTIDLIRPSMLSSMTESYEGVWFNATQKPNDGVCEFEETYEEVETITVRIPYEVEVEVWCWSIRCTEMETRYREEKKTQNVTKTRKMQQCCDDYELDPETQVCKPICATPCENYGICVEPSTCKCEFNYEGKYCEIDPLPEGILTGPNVCERQEMKEEFTRIMEQQIVETTFKEWCWPKIRCTKTKMEQIPVEKMQKVVKPILIRFCCEGFEQNFMGNRCFPIADNNQQQIIQ